ncbi:MAG: response regulator transcription factor [Gemmatimonas sp.]
MDATAQSANNTRILFVEDDQLFRETVTKNLQDAGYAVQDFDCGVAALQYLKDGGQAELALLDWKMPSLSGIELFRKLREENIDIPIIFVTSLSDQVYEEAALMNGAVDFIDKTRSFAILLSRISTVLNGRKGQSAPRPLRSNQQAVVQCGDLELHLHSNRAMWKGKRVNLTLAEFKIVHHLASQVDRDIPHREIYDIVRGPGFLAGDGENGYRSNVRTFIKRIRRKFGEVDTAFDRIATYSGFGYRWMGEGSSAEDADLLANGTDGALAVRPSVG